GAPSHDEIGDLTESFNAMGARLQRTLDDLRYERSRLETVLQHLPVGVAIRSAPDGDLVLGSAQAERIWARQFVTDGAPAARITVGPGCHADGRPYAPDEWPIQRALLHGEEVRGEQMTIGRGDGSNATIVVSAAPIRDADGQIVAAVSSFDDVTERRETE